MQEHVFCERDSEKIFKKNQPIKVMLFVSHFHSSSVTRERERERGVIIYLTFFLNIKFIFLADKSLV